MFRVDVDDEAPVERRRIEKGACVNALGRIGVTFGLPALFLAAVSTVVWLSLASSQTGFGPMRRVTPATAEIGDTELEAPPATELEKLSPSQAALRNAILPYSHAGLGLPSAFRATAEPLAVASECMTRAIYYEAAREPEIGKRAVAQVILNRAGSTPFPSTICGVVEQGAGHSGCQFTFMCDGSLARRPDPALWSAARKVADAALSGAVEPSVGDATHYHADYVFPTWAPTMAKLAKLGQHIFYRWRAAALKPLAPTGVGDAVAPAAAVDSSDLGGASPSVATDAPLSPAASSIEVTTPGVEALSPAQPSTIVERPADPEATVGKREETSRPKVDHPRRATPDRPLGAGPV